MGVFVRTQTHTEGPCGDAGRRWPSTHTKGHTVGTQGEVVVCTPGRETPGGTSLPTPPSPTPGPENCGKTNVRFLGPSVGFIMAPEETHTAPCPAFQEGSGWLPYLVLWNLSWKGVGSLFTFQS